eukprot:GEMP01009964.1.p1 GENE.GEMP01009964.1~~GEMP01009964.1.p1  ORF type:complete len:537 (+),score=109.80 GEMP01009964.1:398-2008(+)
MQRAIKLKELPRWTAQKQEKKRQLSDPPSSAEVGQQCIKRNHVTGATQPECTEVKNKRRRPSSSSSAEGGTQPTKPKKADAVLPDTTADGSRRNTQAQPAVPEDAQMQLCSKAEEPCIQTSATTCANRRGIPNYGNSCYLVSAVQILLDLPGATQLMRTASSLRQLNGSLPNNEDEAAVCMISDLLEFAAGCTTAKPRESLKVTLEKLIPILMRQDFGGESFKDAQEALVEIAAIYKKATCWDLGIPKLETHRTRKTNCCAATRTTHQQDSMLHLHLLPNSTLQSAVDEYFTDVHLQDGCGVDCEACGKKKAGATIHTSCNNPPEKVLVQAFPGGAAPRCTWSAPDTIQLPCKEGVKEYERTSSIQYQCNQKHYRYANWVHNITVNNQKVINNIPNMEHYNGWLDYVILYSANASGKRAEDQAPPERTDDATSSAYGGSAAKRLGYSRANALLGFRPRSGNVVVYRSHTVAPSFWEKFPPSKHESLKEHKKAKKIRACMRAAPAGTSYHRKGCKWVGTETRSGGHTRRSRTKQISS